MSKKKISKFNLNNFEGIFPIIYSFFNKNNSLDIKAIIEEINIIHSIGAQGIASLGLATEVNKLTFKEKTINSYSRRTFKMGMSFFITFTTIQSSIKQINAI